MIISIDLPLRVRISSRKHFILNLNNYRNAHYTTLNKAKRGYSSVVQKIIKSRYPGLTIANSVDVIYRYHHASKRKIDVANPCSIIDKFTCDALTNCGFWPDDCVDIVNSVKYEYAGVDKSNPRCTMIISDIST